MPIPETTDAEFQTAVAARAKPVLVDFYAPWCGPCSRMLPILHDFADAWSNRVDIVKVNIDDNPRIASQLRVRTVPSFFLFRDGILLDGGRGSMTHEELADWVQQATRQ